MQESLAMVVDTYEFLDKATGAQKIGIKLVLQDEDRVGVVQSFMAKSPLTDKLRVGTIVDVQVEMVESGLNSYTKATISGVSNKKIALSFE